MTDDSDCVTPLAREPISAEQADRLAGLFKAMSDPVRLRLLSIVLSHANHEACVCEMAHAFEIGQPTVSYHLKVLHQSGLLARQRRGTWVYYRAVPEVMAALVELLGPDDTTRVTAEDVAS